MPELPEVETVRAGLAEHLPGRRLRGVELRRADLRWPIPADAVHALVGSRCTGVARRAKYLLLQFAGPRPATAIVHLGMTGRLFVDVTRAGAASAPWRPHEHWRMQFAGRTLRYVDPRRFGALDTVPTAALAGHRLLAGLGREPLEPGFDGAFLHAITRGRRAPVKAVLMDGRLLVGVGNIYASEACWRAQVRPRRAARTLTRAACDALALAVREVLRAAIAAGGTSFRDYVGVAEDAGFFARELAVYDRAGSACRRCGGTIASAVTAGRSTFWCPRCQR